MTRGENHRILVIRLGSFGDIILTEPVTRALKRAFPDSQVWFLTKSEFCDLPDMFAGVDRVLGYCKQSPLSSVTAATRGECFDLIVDLQNNLRSLIIAHLLKAKRRVRYRRQLLKRFLLVYMPWLWKGRLKHTLDLYSQALTKVELEADDIPRIKPPPQHLEKVSKELGSTTWIGLCPGGSSSHKRWGSERFGELAKLLTKLGKKTVIVGSFLDANEVDESVKVTYGDTIRALVTNDFKELAAVLASCKVVVTNDSGLMHLAAAVGTKVVAIFGPTSPDLGFSPLSPWTTIIHRDMDCSPCSYHGNRPCRRKNRECLDLIEPAEVADLVNQLLSEEP